MAAVRLLLERGASIEAVDNRGWSAERIAEFNGKEEVGKLIRNAKREEAEQPYQVGKNGKQTWRQRAIGAIVWAIAGVFLTVIAFLFLGHPKEWDALLIWSGVVGVIAGAISGTDRKVIVAAVVGLAVAVPLVEIQFKALANTNSVSGVRGVVGAWMFGGPILGAIVGIIFKKLKWWR